MHPGMHPEDLLAWHKRHAWLLGIEPATERLQAEQEGRAPGAWSRQLARLAKEAPAAQETPSKFRRWLERNQAVLDAVQGTPIRKDFPFVEPDDLGAIHKGRPKSPPVRAWSGTRKAFAERLHGALLGRRNGRGAMPA